MVGKSMRCPNSECRQVFTVKPQAREIEPPKSDPIPVPQPRPLPLPPDPAKRSPKPKPAVVDAQIVDAAIVAPPKVKEVVWSEGTDAPPAGRQPMRPEVLDDTDEQPILRRKKKKSRGPWILIGMSAVIVMLIGFGVLYVVRFQHLTEQNLAKQADEEYKKGDYSAAAKSFEKLAADYPSSDEAARYAFFADLSGTQIVVRAVTNREEPDAAVERLKKLIAAQKDSPFAKHTSGFGRDILEAGKKLGEDVAGHADDRVKAFRADRSGKPGELDRADKSVATGRELLPLLEPFRARTTRRSTRSAATSIALKPSERERERTVAIAKARADLEKLSDATIQRVENDLTAVGFEKDAEAMSLIAEAKGKLRELVKYEIDQAAPRNPPTSAAASILFVAPIGPTRRAPPAGIGVEAPPSVFLAVARGVLYALDEEGGTLLWAVRVGADITDPPTVARVDLDEGPTDLAIVASNVAGESAVAGYVVKTGKARWYQPLPAPAAGPAVVVGTRAYVAIRDEQGTIYEFDLTSGTRRGRIRLGQPVGHNAVAVRPGSGLLYAAADARRVYVIDAGAKDDDGNLLPLRCVQVIATGHLPGTLRTPPLLLGPESDAPGERWMILSQANGRDMMLRAFSLQPIQAPQADGKAPPETFVPPVDQSVSGWAWYSPVSDGERIAVATDFGQFRVFGVKQPGSLDEPLFHSSEPRHRSRTTGRASGARSGFPSRGSRRLGDREWNLQKFRVGLVPSRGPELIPVGASVPIGEPTQRLNSNNRRDGACLVVRSLNSAGCKAVLLNLRDGNSAGSGNSESCRRQIRSFTVKVCLIAETAGWLRTGRKRATSGRAFAASAEWVIASRRRMRPGRAWLFPRTENGVHGDSRSGFAKSRSRLRNL